MGACGVRVACRHKHGQACGVRVKCARVGERVGARRRDDVDAMTEEQVADGVGVFHTSASALVGSGWSLAAHNALSEHHIHRGRGRMRTAHLISYSKSRCPSLSSMWRTTCPDQIAVAKPTIYSRTNAAEKTANWKAWASRLCCRGTSPRLAAPWLGQRRSTYPRSARWHGSVAPRQVGTTSELLTR